MLKIELHEEDFLPHQWEFLNSWDRTLGLVGGLGSGKSVAFLFKTLICLMSRPGANAKANIGIGYPTYEMGKNIFFYPFCELLESCNIPFTANTSGLQITCVFGRFAIKSLQHPERIIGETFTDAGVDELDSIPMPKGEKIVKRFRERLRGRTDSQFYLVSSPEGFSTCYEILQHKPNPGTKLIRARTYDNYHLSKSYIDDILASYDRNMARAYLEGEFVNLNSLAAYYAFQRERHIAEVPKPPKGTVLHIGVDFNVHPMTACVGYFDGDVYKVFSEYYVLNSNTFMLADLIYADYGGDYPIIIYPDPTGGSRKTSSDISDLEILQRKGFELRYRYGFTQRRSLNLTNGAFDHDRIIIDPSCTHLIADLEQVVTDNYGQIEKPAGTMLTHISDALRNVILINSLEKEQNRDWVRL
jgi:hypothetical protein